MAAAVCTIANGGPTARLLDRQVTETGQGGDRRWEREEEGEREREGEGEEEGGGGEAERQPSNVEEATEADRGLINGSRAWRQEKPREDEGERKGERERLCERQRL
jgi:hypothetical protein